MPIFFFSIRLQIFRKTQKHSLCSWENNKPVGQVYLMDIGDNEILVMAVRTGISIPISHTGIEADLLSQAS